MTARRARRARHFKGAEPIIGFERGEVQKKGDAQLEEGQCAIRRRAMRNLHRRLVAAGEEADNDNLLKVLGRVQEVEEDSAS